MKRFSLLMAAALLMGLCACTTPEPPEPTPSPAPATPAPTASPASPAPTAEPDPSPAPEPDPVPEEDIILPAGGRDYPAGPFSGDLTGGGLMELDCLLPAAEMSAEFAHNAWVFRSTEVTEAFLEVSFITGGEVESLLPGLLDGYLDFTEIEFSEAASLGRLRGDVGQVSASGGGLDARGLLLELEGGVLSAVLVCPAAEAETEALLQAVLDTLDVK
jgi:hypothetical protein